MKIKSIVLGSLLSAAFSTAYSETNIKDINKDMRIMKRIFETSLNDNEERGFRSKPVDAIYLARQGLVFTFQSSGINVLPGFSGDWEAYGESMEAWGEAFGESVLTMVEGIVPVVEPLAPDAAEEMRAEIADEMAHITDNSSEQKEIRRELSKLRESVRNKKEMYLEDLRELREIERNLYRSENDEKKELNQRKSKLTKRIEDSKKAMADYESKMKEYRDKRSMKLQISRDKTINNAIATLCDYSASLRSLSSDEHVTLIFEKFSSTKGSPDHIFVFKKNDLNNCEGTESGVKQLKRKAYTYNQ